MRHVLLLPFFKLILNKCGIVAYKQATESHRNEHVNHYKSFPKIYLRRSFILYTDYITNYTQHIEDSELCFLSSFHYFDKNAIYILKHLILDFRPQ